MRRFFRVKLTPPILQGVRARNAADKNLELHKKNEPKTFDNNIWANPDVRGLLYATFGRVCGYCGENLTERDFEVDHYRPQKAVAEDEHHGGYWWLAYEFENYVLACSTCNNTYKRTKFPLLAGKHLTFETKDDVEIEVRALFDPCSDHIDQAFCVNIDSELLPVHKGSDLEDLLDKRLDKRLDKSFEVFGEFADTLTIKGRRKVRREVLNSLDKGDIGKVRRAASRYSPHSQVARATLSEKKIPTPSPEEEIAWLAEDLINDLRFEKSREQAIPLQRTRARKKSKELRYALAALLIAPPQGSPEIVRQILEQNQLIAEIQPYVDMLRNVPADKQSPAQDS